MANEIATVTTSGQTLYAVVRNAQAQAWNTATTAFESVQSAHWTQYALALAEQTGTGFYSASFPAAISASGRYSVDLRQQVGSAPATSDPTVGAGPLRWGGAALGEVDVLASTDKSGYSLDLTQSVPTSNTAQTVGDALNAARAGNFGKWVLSGTTLTLYAADGTTVVRTFTLDSAVTPTSRT
jgi:hypothetical protein